MPGSGKSMIGPKLAARLQVPFFDLDAVIEAQEKKTVYALFRQYGESWFRQTEAEVLRKLPVGKSGAVVATGGGTPCFAGNMQFMNEGAGFTIYLEVPVAELADRLSKSDLKKRPLLAGKNKAELEAYLKDTLQVRQQFYRKAKLIVGPETGADDKLENLVNALRCFP